MKKTTLSAAVACLLAVAGPAHASFHLMQIWQAVGGVQGYPQAQAVNLRMRAQFQNLLGPSRLRAWDAAGLNPVLIVDFGASVPSGNQGDFVLVVSPTFASQVAPGDFLMANLIPPSYLAAGRLTFEDDSGNVYWSLAWGGAAYTGPNDGLTFNDADGNFGPPAGAALPTNGQGILFSGPADALSTSNLADYMLSPGAAQVCRNDGVCFVAAPGTLIFRDGFGG
jgi:hypothetical protein